MARTIAALFCVVLIASTALVADVVVMKSGEKLEGVLDAVNEKQVTLKVDDSKKVLDRSEVLAIHLNVGLEDFQKRDKNTGLDIKDAIAFGETGKSKNLSIRIVSAKIAKTRVKTITDPMAVSTDDNLNLVLSIKNTSERKIVRFADQSGFFSNKLTMHDDVENVIQRIHFGIAANVVGALTKDDEILPGEEVEHVEVFKVPPPKTEWLLLTIDLSAFGDAGVMHFKIPIKKKQGVQK